MGKCKKRTLYKTNTSYFMTREEAVSKIFKTIDTNFNKKSRSSKDFNIKEALSTISLFGISAEELSEAGVSYENLKALENVIS